LYVPFGVFRERLPNGLQMYRKAGKNSRKIWEKREGGVEAGVIRERRYSCPMVRSKARGRVARPERRDKKKALCGNRRPSNDCLPYEKR